MANFGLSMPWIAELDEKTNTYSNAFQCDELVNTSVNPQFNTATLFSNNRKRSEMRKLKTADVILGVAIMPKKAVEIMYGHKINAEGEELSNAADKQKYVGYAFIVKELDEDGSEKYRACLLFKVIFSEGQEDYETQGENVVFKTPSVNGSALTLNNGDWRLKSPHYETEEEANEWIKKKFGVTDTPSGTE